MQSSLSRCLCCFEDLRAFELRQRFLLSLLVDIRVLHDAGFEEFKAPESGNRAFIRLDTQQETAQLLQTE